MSKIQRFRKLGIIKILPKTKKTRQKNQRRITIQRICLIISVNKNLFIVLGEVVNRCVIRNLVPVNVAMRVVCGYVVDI